MGQKRRRVILQGYRLQSEEYADGKAIMCHYVDKAKVLGENRIVNKDTGIGQCVKINCKLGIYF